MNENFKQLEVAELRKRLEKGRWLVNTMQVEIEATRATGQEPLEEKEAMFARYSRFLNMLEAEIKNRTLE